MSAAESTFLAQQDTSEPYTQARAEEIPQRPQLTLVPSPEPTPSPDTSIAAGSVSLRPYQRDCSRSVLHQFGKEKNHSTLCVLATGTGKTIIMADLARRANDRNHGVLWLCHREELMDQARKALSRMGIHPLIEKAESRAIGEFGITSKTVIASVPTLRGGRLEQWPQDSFGLIISDESHHAISPTWKLIPEYFSRARHVGFTATADRLDKQNIGQVFESLAYEYNIRAAIEDRWLVKIEAMQIRTDPPIDLRELRIVAGDFNSGDLEAVIQENIGTLVNAIVQENALEDRPTIAFTPDIASAEALALALNDVGISADSISYKTRDRARVFERYRNREFQVLTNAMLVTEGVDLPFVSCILMCRPTKSRALYSQMVGRGTRPFPSAEENTKENCRVVDFAFITGKHSLVSPVDLYDNSQTADEVVAMAREMVEKGEERDIDAALQNAQEAFDLEERVRIQRRRVSVKKGQFDPVSVRELLGIRDKDSYGDWMTVNPATPKMIAALRKFKVNVPDDIGFQEAKRLMDACCARANHNLASLPQINLLIRLGMEPGEARRTSFRAASAWISAHKTW